MPPASLAPSAMWPGLLQDTAWCEGGAPVLAFAETSIICSTPSQDAGRISEDMHLSLCLLRGQSLQIAVWREVQIRLLV